MIEWLIEWGKHLLAFALGMAGHRAWVIWRKRREDDE